MDLISVIVPFLNEKESITHFCQVFDKAAVGKPYDMELIFVDDGSTDNTAQLISDFSFEFCKQVKLVQLSKNYGAHQAIRAGILQAQGNYCTYVGADLQEPANMVDVMYEKAIEGFDAVYIEKRDVEVGLLNRAFSHTYATLMKRYAVPNFGNGGINNIFFNRKIIDYLNDNIELNSSLMLQIINAGYKNTTIQMDYNSRKAGVSKWTFSKKIKLFIDSFVAFSFMPIRAVSLIGIILALAGIVYGLVIVISRLCNPAYVAGYATMVSIMLFGFGITNISLGIIAEYLWRAFDAARNRPAFLISEIKTLK